jgi:hypothetical protein
METENHGKKCQFCALLERTIGNSPNNKIISKNEDFILLDLMEKNRMGMIIMSTLHNNWDVKHRTKTHKLVELIKMATVLLKGDTKIISCREKAKHYHIKIFPK